MSSAPKPIVPSVNQWNAEYLEEQHRLFKADPGSVSGELRAFFEGFELANAGELKLFGAGDQSSGSQGGGGSAGKNAWVSEDSGPVQVWAGGVGVSGRVSHFEAVVNDFVNAYRDQGHLCADIDPFHRERERPELLSLEHHGLTEADLDRVVDGSGMGLGMQVPLRDVIARLEKVYCGSIGLEVMHVTDTAKRAWLVHEFEIIGGKLELDRSQKTEILEQLVKSEMIEKFLGRRYPGDKRFSLEGGESLIPMLDQLILTASDLGAEELVFGMAHRGRLNVLNNTIGKTYEQIFTEFEENWSEDFVDGGGDVKYHQGYSGTRRFSNGKMVHLALASNPSHLEAVNGVIEGRARAKQRLKGDFERSRVIPVLIHGDAAVVGQGIVAEVLNFSQLEGYTTGGTVHVVVNNQIGFTTIPEDSRSSRYCTDIGKSIDAPIFHVNAEDPEAVVTVAKIAMEYRQQFKQDVFIDLQCFRRYGHNEQDETSFTQPLMAAMIKKKESVLKLYTDKLLGDEVIQEADRRAIDDRITETLERAQRSAQETAMDPTIDPGSQRWAGQTHEHSFDFLETGISREMISEVAAAISTVPDGFNLNPKLKKLLKERGELANAEMISYADAEQLAFGSLLVEGHPIRLSGQDCRRGTFSHRHAVIRDTKTAEAYTPLNNIRELGIEGTDEPAGSMGSDGKERQAKLCVYDSPLSEASVLGFDYGYSLADPRMLVIWEAQFGDFVNGAQAIIDQFIASAEGKWDRWSGLVMLLPHGYEGAGPEHSSCRVERFLELCGGNNMQVVNPSTAAQVFHMYRRQMNRSFRKPLVVLTPKSMLRTPTSELGDILDGGFVEMIDDPKFVSGDWDRSGVKRVLLCSGKIYHELHARRELIERSDTAILRIEQIYPFHADMLQEIVSRYPDGVSIEYVQEETYNGGAWLFVSDMVQSKLGWDRPGYIGRARSSSPATGSKSQHKIEQESILTEAIGAKPEESGKEKKVAAARA
ncbi:MAG: 2-oxoglutarate dehydrogenase E1 component [Phycisphaerales bacterium]|nr:2-oxoglutarate dehydrogenase E1 component [Phycisphaerales bacterium]